MASNAVALVSLDTVAAASPQKSLVKIEPPPPSLIKNASDMLEDGEINEQQVVVNSLQDELQLAKCEYSALKDCYKRLQRQHTELQDLASAYSEVIRGTSPAVGQTVAIDQLQAEAGKDGLRVKALQAEVLGPLIREAGGTETLISQNNLVKSLIDKAGGPRELEHFALDLRAIRDTLSEIRGSPRLTGLATDVRELLQSKRKYVELAREVNGPNGLREKAAKFEKLQQAFADIQAFPLRQQPPNDTTSMNPDRARMISSAPLDADPDRDLYEAPPPVSKPNNRTGSNNTPLGVPQEQLVDLSSKRKYIENATSAKPTKRRRVDVGRASALLQAALSDTPSNPADRAADCKDSPNIQTRTMISMPRDRAGSVHGTDALLGHSISTDTGQAFVKGQLKASQTEGRSSNTETTCSELQAKIAPTRTKRPEWMHFDVRFAPTVEAPKYSSTPAQDCETHTAGRLTPVRFSTETLDAPDIISSTADNVEGAQAYPLATAPAPLIARVKQANTCSGYLQEMVAFWVGGPDASAVWDESPRSNLKRNLQTPGELFGWLTVELSRLIPAASYGIYKTMTVNHDTCILRYVIDGHRPLDQQQKRVACWVCTHQRRPCALLQKIEGRRMVVFLPLRGHLRAGVKWEEKGFWIQQAQKADIKPALR